jgi:hypothetical protein
MEKRQPKVKPYYRKICYTTIHIHRKGPVKPAAARNQEMAINSYYQIIFFHSKSGASLLVFTQKFIPKGFESNDKMTIH